MRPQRDSAGTVKKAERIDRARERVFNPCRE